MVEFRQKILPLILNDFHTAHDSAHYIESFVNPAQVHPLIAQSFENSTQLGGPFDGPGAPGFWILPFVQYLLPGDCR